MAWRLPSLNGLRAFEAAGRNGSFTAAARELNVTQAAISRMVRLLERRLGYDLFRRHGNALELTVQGKALLSGLTESFASIARVTEQVSAMRDDPALTVGIGPTLAVNWLIPRLSGFYRSYPDVGIRVASGGAMGAVCDDWTCTVRRDTDAWPGYVAEHLFPSAVIPVCTPEVASGLRRPEDLRDATLIFVPHQPNEWPLWFAAAGVRKPVHSAGEVSFDSNAMAMQAALDGVGVAIAQLSYVSDAIATGRLVAPFPTVARKRENWLLQYRPVRGDDPALRRFRDWLHREAKRQSEAETVLLRLS